MCTGSLLLGAAGILTGKRATTHWIVQDELNRFNAGPSDDRVVTDGKIITSAGVSAGIDMALTLAAAEAGETTARTLQLVIEYDPQPPFDSGSLARADGEVRQNANRLMSPGTERVR